MACAHGEYYIQRKSGIRLILIRKYPGQTMPVSPKYRDIEPPSQDFLGPGHRPHII